MSTLSVPLPPNLIEFIEREVKMGNYSNKAALVRKAIAKLQEDALVEAVLQSKREVAEGKVFYGDLKEIAKKFKS